MPTHNILIVVNAVLWVSLATHTYASEKIGDSSRLQISLKGYAVQVGAFRKSANAQRSVKRLRKQHVNSRIIPVQGPSGERIYRVITGSFKVLKAAYQRKAELARRGIATHVIQTSLLINKATPPDSVHNGKPTQTIAYGNSTKMSAQKSARLTRSYDDKRPKNQYTVTLGGRPLTIGGEYRATSDNRKDFALASNEQDDLSKINFQTQLELFYPFSDDNSVFFEVKGGAEREIYREDDQDLKSNEAFERGEMWVYLGKFFSSDFSLQIGRQDFDESREWWWDEDLDAVRLHYDRRPWRLELSIAEELARVSADEDQLDPEQADVRRLLGRATWRLAKKHRLEFFFLNQRDRSFTHQAGQIIDKKDEDKSDADLTWIGVRAKGRWNVHRLGKFYYWLDTAIVRGDEVLIDFDDAGPDLRIVDGTENRDIHAWGLDLGLTWQTSLSWRPSFTLGYAIGSGDADPNDATDRNFRQTGLHDNNDRFRGVNSFRYYGELLRPELSNLHIFTASFGFPI